MAYYLRIKVFIWRCQIISQSKHYFNKWSVTYCWHVLVRFSLMASTLFGFSVFLSQPLLLSYVRGWFLSLWSSASCGECCWTQLPIALWLVIKRAPQGYSSETCQCECVKTGSEYKHLRSLWFDLLSLHCCKCCGFYLWHPLLQNTTPQESFEAQI